MFRKRVKKDFPEGTFIPFPARLCAILQLCIAFGALLWIASQPFMGELFEIKSQKLLLHYAIDQRELFEQLPQIQQEQLLTRLVKLQEKLERPFWEKLKQSGSTLLQLPLLKLAWLFLSIILSVMLLKKRDGAAQALWLLPFLALAYGIDNRLNTLPPQLTAEERLFPNEKYLIEYYLDKPFSAKLFEQKLQLEQAWNNYLQEEWGSPEYTLEKGLYSFNLARIQTIPLQKKWEPSQEALPLLFLFIFWNLLFVVIANKSKQKILI